MRTLRFLIAAFCLTGALIIDVGCSSPTASLSTAKTLACPSPSNKVLVDASHDGGVWWYPQVAPFVSDSPHQGQALADTLRNRGYTVDELWRGAVVSSTMLSGYTKVIRAAGFESYFPSELQAYTYLASCPVTILLLGEFLLPGQTDALATELGVTLEGSFDGNVTVFASHPITAGVASVAFIAGSQVDTSLARSVQALGWLQTGEPVMGLVTSRPAKIFFLGDVNGMEQVPQPLVDNLIAWGF